MVEPDYLKDQPDSHKALQNGLPSSHESERAIIGAILLDNTILFQAMELFDTENGKDFDNQNYRLVFLAMISLFELGKVINAITIDEELTKNKNSQRVGGVSGIMAIMHGLPHSTNIQHYADILIGKRKLRQLMKTAMNIFTEANQQESEANIILGNAQQAVFQLAESGYHTSLEAIDETLVEVIDNAHANVGHGLTVTGVATGFADIDLMTAGLQNSDLVLLAARPSLGKTALAGCIINNVTIHNEQRVAFFSLEMSKRAIVSRLLCCEARVDYKDRFSKGFMNHEEWDRIDSALARMQVKRMYLDDKSGIEALEIRAKIMRMSLKVGKPDLIVVDYLQLMTGQAEHRRESKRQEIAGIGISLKSIAKEFNVPVLALSQLSRASESRSDKRPQLSDLRECVVGETLVQLADGSRQPIESLVGKRPSIMTINDKLKVITAKPEAIWHVGIKPTFEIRLASGRKISATPDHRLLTINGWQKIKDLSVGSRVAIARRIPEPKRKIHWSDLRIAFLGHMIGDGSYKGAGQSVRYTTGSEENSAIVKLAAEQEFNSLVKRADATQGTWHQLVFLGDIGGSHPYGVRQWFKDLGIFGQGSWTKRIPIDCFSFSNEQVAILIRHLWATDGTICFSKGVKRKTLRNPNVSFCSCSKDLLRDISSLLLRFGIVSRISEMNLHISGCQNISRFIKHIGAFGPKVKGLNLCQEYIKQTIGNTNVDTIPIDVWSRIRSVVLTKDTTSQKFSKVFRASQIAQVKHSPSRERVQSISRILNDDRLKVLGNSDVFWDKILSIKYVGKKDVYDMSVPKTSCWLADSIVTHNSGTLEQDADVVMMIHREVVPSQNSGEHQLVQSNVAELIIAKQRNGPTGVVTLRFDGPSMRFDNLAAGG